MKIIGIIPSRYASTRFSGKPLVDIGGKTMIRHVYEQASKSKSLSQVIVATDDERIYTEVKNFGGNAIITAATHNNGTERCAEVATTLNADVVINIQGDEPFIQPEQIDLLAALFSKSEVQIGTLVKKHVLDEELKNPSRIKVVLNKNMEAIYFSRSVIPYLRESSQYSILNTQYYKHIGIYGYRINILKELVKLKPSVLELAESLEQLRWLENGYRISCAVTTHDSASIDTPEDLLQLLKTL
ncbi:MAG: kdsB [Bacteroidota bacterium]|nr:kdsB [Bacteroidota bacterium]